MVELDTVIEQKISEDADFQATLTDLSEEDKEVALNEKRTELIKQEYSALSDAKTKAEEIAKNQKIRAEKAEAAAKQQKADPDPAKKSEEKETFSLQDIRALNDVHDEDVDKLVNYAKFMGITVAEAKKLPEMEAYRKDAEEKRKTAQATVIKGGKGAPKHKDLLERANQGDLPDDDEGINALIAAQRETLVNKK